MGKFVYHIFIISIVAVFFCYNLNMLSFADKGETPTKMVTSKEIATKSDAMAVVPDLWTSLLHLTGSKLFSVIFLPFVCLILNTMGKVIANLVEIKSSETRINSVLTAISSYTDISLVSIAAVFYAHPFLSEEREITKPLVGAFIIWLLFIIGIFILSCLLAGLSGEKSRLFLDKNSIIGVHIPNALGLFSLLISLIIYINIGVN